MARGGMWVYLTSITVNAGDSGDATNDGSRKQGVAVDCKLGQCRGVHVRGNIHLIPHLRPKVSSMYWMMGPTTRPEN
jgi:hypothetical protein